MWNKIILATSIWMICCLKLQAQEFLGKSKPDIERFIQTNSTRISRIQQEDNNLQFVYEEEDERNRLFEVSYCFYFQNGICSTYEKQLPRNEYWMQTIHDLVALKKGKASGNTLEIDNDTLSSQYRFDTFLLEIRSTDVFLIEIFKNLPAE